MLDVLILNTAAIDLRRQDFEFVDELVGEGGLAKCNTQDMPSYSQQQLAEWIDQGFATAGGPGNTAPLMAKSGLTVSVGANLGKGDYNGLDAQGCFFYDVMIANDIDMSQIFIHPTLPTGTTYIHDTIAEERGGIAYFPNANNDFDFGYFRKAVDKLEPKIVYSVMFQLDYVLFARSLSTLISALLNAGLRTRAICQSALIRSPYRLCR